MRRNYWKEGCLLLIGLFIGSIYGRYITPATTSNVISKDTIIVHDTIIQKAIPSIPPLNAKNVLIS